MKAIKGELGQLKKLQKQYSKVKQQEKTQHHQAESQLAKQLGKVPPLSDEDVKIFRSSIKGVTPLPESNRLDRQAQYLKNPEFYQAKREQAEGEPMLMQVRKKSDKVKPASQPKRVTAKKIALEEDTYLAQGKGKDLLKKLNQGYWPIGATLDLHGANLDQAADRFDRFVGACIEHEIRCFLIIHGKGHGSKQGKAVLKSYLTAWLRDIEAIAAFIPAPESLGGSGALLVLSNKKADPFA